MKLKDLEAMINEQATVDRRYVGAALPALLRKTYLWMTFALIITGIVAYGMTTVTYTSIDGNVLPIAFKIFENRGAFWIIFIAELAMVFVLSSRIMRLSLGTATLLFIAYSALNGVMLSSIFLVYTMESISTAFFVTAGTFGAMSLYGYFTKSSLDGLGKYLTMALVGLLIAIVVNLFLKCCSPSSRPTTRRRSSSCLPCNRMPVRARSALPCSVPCRSTSTSSTCSSTSSSSSAQETTDDRNKP